MNIETMEFLSVGGRSGFGNGFRSERKVVASITSIYGHENFIGFSRTTGWRMIETYPSNRNNVPGLRKVLGLMSR